MTLELRPWRGLEGFAAQAAAWDECLRARPIDPLCNAHAWTLAHARAFTPDADVFGWTLVRADGKPAGVLALRREPSRGALALRRALFLADGTFDSDYLEPPVAPGEERAAVRALMDAACRVRGLEALVLSGIPETSPFLRELRAELDERGMPRRELPVACLAAELAGSLDAFIATLKSRMRSKVRSALRNAASTGARVTWTARAEDVELHLADLFRLHELRWQAEGRTGSFADPRRRAFYTDVAREALSHGQLRLARLERDGVVLASQLGLVAGDRYYQIQEGYDPAFEEERVGVALRALGLEDLMRAGVRSYDFMAGDARHKRDWGGVDRPCTTVAFPLARWRPRLTFALRGRVDRWRAARVSSEASGEAED